MRNEIPVSFLLAADGTIGVHCTAAVPWPAEDAFVCRDQLGAMVQSGCRHESICRVAVEIRQSRRHDATIAGDIRGVPGATRQAKDAGHKAPGKSG